MKIIFTLIGLLFLTFSSVAQNDVRATVKSNGVTAEAWLMAETAPVPFNLGNNNISLSLCFSLPANGETDPGLAPAYISATTPIPGPSVNTDIPVEVSNDRFVYTFIITGGTPSMPDWEPMTEHLVFELEFGPEVSGDFPRLDNLLYSGGGQGQGYLYFEVNSDYRSDTEGDQFYGGTEGMYDSGDGLDAYVEAPAPLPISMIAFDVKKYGERSSFLSWSTASEINSSHFSVQRSTDKKSWGTVGRVNAAGNSHLVENYNFVDENVYNGLDTRLTVYYRLQMVDRDGQLKNSPIKTVVFGSDAITASFASSIYPNPTSDGVFVDWSADNADQPTLIELYDVTGKLLIQQDVAPESNQEYIDFTPVKVQPGLYLIRMVNGTEVLGHQQIVVAQSR